MKWTIEMPRIESPESTFDEDDSREFDEPIKINWTGYARSRIWEYNVDASDDNWPGDHFYRPSIYLHTMERQKTNVVIKTKREAECVRYELDNYDVGRMWVNHSIKSVIDRVEGEIDDAMRERGYEPQIEMAGSMVTVPHFVGYEVDG